MRVGVIGAGRVGAVLAHALRASGHDVVGATAVSEASVERVETLLLGTPILASDEILRRAQIVLLTVPDDAIGRVTEGLASLGLWTADHIVMHTSGVHGLEVLEPARAAGAIAIAIHPVMTFTGTSLDVPRLQGLPFAVTGQGIHSTIGEGLVLEMGGEPFHVKSADRALYHAALAHGANNLVTLVTQAQRLLAAAGIESSVLGPLLNAALDGALTSGEARLTGPVARGDIGTIEAHLTALSEAREGDISETYRALTATTARRARMQGRIDAATEASILSLLERL